MAADDLQPLLGDTDNNLLRKLVLGFYKGIFGSGGGGGGGGSTKIVDGTGVGGAAVTGANALKVDGSAVTQPVNGTVNVGNFPGTQPVSIASTVTIQAPTSGTGQNDDTHGLHVTLGNTIPFVAAQDNALATVGAKADAKATDSTSSWSVVALLKGLYSLLSGTLTVNASGNAVPVTNAGLTNIDVALSTRLKPADTLAAVTSITNPVAVTNAGLTNIDVALSTRLKPADTLAAVTTVSNLTQGNVGGFTTIIKDTTAVTAASYSAGNAVGGKRTLTNALRTSNGTGILDSITILDRNNQSAGMTIFIFDSNPGAATITDHSAFVFSTDDLKVIAQISIAASDYVTTNSKAIACLKGLGIALKGADGSASLYAAVVTTGTPTFANTTDVQVQFGILQD